MPVDYEDHLAGLTDFKGPRPGHHGPQAVLPSCPFCGAEDKLWVNVDNGLWHCYRCEEGGGYIRLVAALSGCSLSDAAASLRDGRRRAPEAGSLGDLAARLGGLTLDGATEAERVEADLPDGFVPCFDGSRWRVPRFLSRRGVPRGLIQVYGLGYCETGRCRNRVVIPVVTGTERAWQARAIRTGPSVAKYLSPPVDMGRLLFGEPLLRPKEETVVIVEGAFDSIRLTEYGVPSVAILGKNLSDRQLAILSARTSSVVVLLDTDDERAEASAIKVADDLRGSIATVKIARLPSGLDPDTATREEIDDALREAVDHGSIAGRCRSALVPRRLPPRR